MLNIGESRFGVKGVRRKSKIVGIQALRFRVSWLLFKGLGFYGSGFRG